MSASCLSDSDRPSIIMRTPLLAVREQPCVRVTQLSSDSNAYDNDDSRKISRWTTAPYVRIWQLYGSRGRRSKLVACCNVPPRPTACLPDLLEAGPGGWKSILLFRHPSARRPPTSRQPICVRRPLSSLNVIALDDLTHSQSSPATPTLDRPGSLSRNSSFSVVLGTKISSNPVPGIVSHDYASARPPQLLCDLNLSAEESNRAEDRAPVRRLRDLAYDVHLYSRSLRGERPASTNSISGINSRPQQLPTLPKEKMCHGDGVKRQRHSAGHYCAIIFHVKGVLGTPCICVLRYEMQRDNDGTVRQLPLRP
ncbi:hypothetical protein CC78DRAFT_576803 [Lojkania enalia]|uniref:Uncharacterized protein n=1 Tax=Lojkania enalia TaxID=147567 RepID=A0A9P4N6Q4_9PLEO|nr:hypothetical protein CC78DRAFT_576803 [Didymosphaeria enalia]